MKLSYRGVNYDFNPSSLQYRGAKYRLAEAAKARSLGAILTYRGAAYAIEPNTQNASATASVSPAVLTYRGVSYTVQPTVQPALVPQTASVPVASSVATAKAPARSLQAQARALTMDHHRAMKKRQQVMLVRSAAEIGMTAAAVSHWERMQETFNPAF